MKKNKRKIITGIRPTGSLTLANFLGSIKQIKELQDKYPKEVYLFVADVHALTDHESRKVSLYRKEVIYDYLALGIDPQKSIIYYQSDIFEWVAFLSLMLAKLIPVSNLLQLPTLKEKLVDGKKPENANVLLFAYPLMMASDILLVKGNIVPIGEDQIPHLEVTRELARRFNKKYKKIFPVPDYIKLKTIRIKSLIGKGKMSKSNPRGAIFLDESPDSVTKKIKSAETATEGQLNEKVENLVLLGKLFLPQKQKEFDEIIKKHLEGQKVMKDLKELVLEAVLPFLRDFQQRKKEIKKSVSIEKITKEGKEKVEEEAQKTISEIKKVIFG